MPRLSLLVLPVLLLVAVASGGSARGAPAAVNCRVPPDLSDTDWPLPLLAAHFKAHEPVTIVVIGGASTAGAAAENGEASAYPHRMEEALRRRHPGVEFTVINKGVPRETAGDMAKRFAKDVFPYSPDLVIWETGTVDAARGRDVEEFAATLQAGIAALRAHKSEVMMVDMQYNPSTASVIDFGSYLDAVHRAADLEGVPLFTRFDIMRFWSDNGVFDLTDVPKDKRAWLAGEVYRCLGENLAEAIDFATTH